MAPVADVAIIGGGPAGGITALALARRGLAVVLLDRARFPREKLCGDFVHPLGVDALRRLDLLAEIAPHGQSLAGMLIVSPQGREVFARFPGGPGLSVSRAVLDDVILRAAARAGADVRAPLAAQHIARQRRWQIRTEAGMVEARFLVGADGLRSRVAGAVGRRRPPRADWFAVGMYIRGLPRHPGFGEMHLAAGSYCGVSSFPDGRANVTMVLPRAWLRPGLARRRSDPLPLATFLAHFPRLHPRLGAASARGPLRATGPLFAHQGPVAGDGVLLVGDAAATTDPLTGLGVSFAVTGGLAAADAIAQAFARRDLSAPALAVYARWHRDRLGGLRAILHLASWLPRTRLIEPLARAWQRDPALAARFLGVLADAAPAREVLNPHYIARVLRSCISSR